MDLNVAINTDLVTMDGVISSVTTGNTSSLKIPITDLKFSLVRYTVLRTKRGQEFMEKTILYSAHGGSVAPGTVIDSPMLCDIKIFEAVDPHGPTLPPSLSEYAGRVQQSVRGTLVTVNYVIQFEPVVDGLTFGLNPTTEFLIQIVAPEKVFAFISYDIMLASAPPGNAEEEKDNGSSDGD